MNQSEIMKMWKCAEKIRILQETKNSLLDELKPLVNEEYAGLTQLELGIFEKFDEIILAEARYLASLE